MMYLLKSYQALKGRWGLVFGALFIYALLSIALGALPGAPLLALFVITPIEIGYILIFLAIARDEGCSVGALFSRFATSKLYWQAIRAKLLILIRVAVPVLISFLASLLLCVLTVALLLRDKFLPFYLVAALIFLIGLCWSYYLAYAYRFAFYTLKDLGAGARARDALNLSKTLSRGYICKLMLLDVISFVILGVIFLSLYTVQLIFGGNPAVACILPGLVVVIAFPVVVAIVQVAVAYLYLEAKAKLPCDFK